MRRMIIIYVSLFVTALLFGCVKDGLKYHTLHTTSFVVEYFTAEKMYLNWESTGGSMDVRLVRGRSNYGVYGLLSEDQGDKDKYMAMCEKYSDTGYDAKFLYGQGSMPNTFQDRNFSAITIVSDADYDGTHPAASSLNDIFYFSSTSHYKFIQSGYKDKFDWGKDYKGNPPLPEYVGNYINRKNKCEDYPGDPVYGLMSDIRQEDMILLGGGSDHESLLASLTPVHAPTIDKLHNFTVTLITDEGEELSASLEVQFE